MPLADWLDFVHALWIEWRGNVLRTQALFALAGADKDMTADPHVDFDDASTTPARQDPEERARIIAALAAV